VNEPYDAMLVRQGLEQRQEFPRLNDAILWIARELNAGHGYTTYGEVRCKGALLWRRGKRSALEQPSKLG
jgi:hypothetical protein